MRVLVCGGRDFADQVAMHRVLDKMHAEFGFTVVIHGAARGADKMAGAWAKARGIPVEPYPANWNKHGNAAGPVRNALMLAQGKPDLVVAFPGGVGTSDMKMRAKYAEVRVIEPIGDSRW
jgi:predicted Rossmann-fold nucleotide-binding protein